MFEVVLSKTGDHVPVNPSMEVVGSVNASPSQIGGSCVNVVFERILMVMSKECSLLQLGVVADSAYTNKVVEAEITSPALSGVPPPLEAVK